MSYTQLNADLAAALRVVMRNLQIAVEYSGSIKNPAALVEMLPQYVKLLTEFDAYTAAAEGGLTADVTHQHYAIIHQGHTGGAQQVTIVERAGNPEEALAGFRKSNPDAHVTGVIERGELLNRRMFPPAETLRGMVGQLAVKLEEASAALPDAWAATQHGVPRDLVESITALVRQTQLLGLAQDPIAPTERPERITVLSGQGNFEICAQTGVVLTPATELPEVFRVYARADVTEYLDWCFVADLEPASEVSVLCFRWVHKSGFVEEAEACFRDDVRRACR